MEPKRHKSLTGRGPERPRPFVGAGRTATGCLRIPPRFRSLSPDRFPLSTRLSNVLRRLGVGTLGDLHGRSREETEAVRGFGSVTIAELWALAHRIESGEFDWMLNPGSGGRGPSLTEFIDGFVESLAQRDRVMLLWHLGGSGRKPMLLATIGRRYGVTRERVRQVVRRLARRLRKKAETEGVTSATQLVQKCLDGVCPLTADLLQRWLGSDGKQRRESLGFYVRVLGKSWPELSVWPRGQERGSVKSRRAWQIVEAARVILRARRKPQPLRDLYRQLAAQGKLADLTVGEFLRALKPRGSVTVVFEGSDSPVGLARVPRTGELAVLVLSQAEAPMKPEEIRERAEGFLPVGARPPSLRRLERVLGKRADFCLFGPRTFGLRHHLTLPERLRRQAARDSLRLLRREGRPVSTREIIQRCRFSWVASMNAYVLAQILRDDKRFTDLGRLNFALSSWGVKRRPLLKALVVEILERTGRPMLSSEILKELQQRRSVHSSSLSNALYRNDRVEAYGCRYYGLRCWGESCCGQ